jgi:hypothetical protein
MFVFVDEMKLKLLEELLQVSFGLGRMRHYNIRFMENKVGNSSNIQLSFHEVLLHPFVVHCLLETHAVLGLLCQQTGDEILYIVRKVFREFELYV